MSKKLAVIAALFAGLGLTAAVVRADWVANRQAWLLDSAHAVYLAELERMPTTERPQFATPNVWASLTETSKRDGKLQSFELRSVHVPIMGYPQTVVVKTVRGGRRFDEMLVTVGSSFNDHQVLPGDE